MSLRTTRTLVSVCAVVLTLSAVVPAWAEASLRGTAKDEQGKPIPGVQVKMLPAVDDFMTLTAKSNKKGKFVFGLIRPTDYRLVAFVDGMRIVRMDINVAEPDDDDFWGFHEDMPSGAETPSFRLTGMSKVTCDLVFAPHDGDPGVFGTGLPVSPVAVITAQIAEGKMDEALKNAEESVKRDPESATFNYLYAFVLRYAERYDEALAAVNKTIEIDEGFEGANLLKGKIVADRGDLEGSLEFFQQEAEWASSESVHRDALLEMTVVYEKLERFDEAIATLEELVVIAPDHAGAHKELADLYLRFGHEEKAQAQVQVGQFLVGPGVFGGDDDQFLERRYGLVESLQFLVNDRHLQQGVPVDGFG